MKLIKLNNKASVTVYGVTFHGFQELREYAIKRKAKDGIFVAADMERYPCFDSEDYATEDRYYWNFVFARSEQGLQTALEKINDVRPEGNYRKLHKNTPTSLLPMVYFGGDTRHYLEVGTHDSWVVAKVENEPPIKILFVGEIFGTTLLSKLLLTNMSKYNYVYESAPCEASAAMATCRNYKPDLMFVANGGATLGKGLRLMEDMKLDEEIRPIPMIAISTLNTEFDHRRAHQIGVSAYIEVPMNQELFINTVHSVVEKEILRI